MAKEKVERKKTKKEANENKNTEMEKEEGKLKAQVGKRKVTRKRKRDTTEKEVSEAKRVCPELESLQVCVTDLAACRCSSCGDQCRLIDLGGNGVCCWE